MVSTLPEVGPMFNQGIRKKEKITWGANAMLCTMEGDEAHYTAFLPGTPSLQAASRSMHPVWKLPSGWVVW